MKPSRPESESRWETLLRQARADNAPPIDVPALLRAVRPAAPVPAVSWLGDIAALCESRFVLPACGLGICVFGGLAAWQAYACWRALPWAMQLLAAAVGGGS